MQIETVGVVGCGLMGHGIAQIAAQGGYKVIVSEADQGALDKGLSRIEKSLGKLAGKLVEKGKKTAEEAEADAAAAFGRITGTLDRADLADCDLICEAIVGNLDVKNQLFKELARILTAIELPEHASVRCARSQRSFVSISMSMGC